MYVCVCVRKGKRNKDKRFKINRIDISCKSIAGLIDKNINRYEDSDITMEEKTKNQCSQVKKKKEKKERMHIYRDRINPKKAHSPTLMNDSRYTDVAS